MFHSHYAHKNKIGIMMLLPCRLHQDISAVCSRSVQNCLEFKWPNFTEKFGSKGWPFASLVALNWPISKLS